MQNPPPDSEITPQPEEAPLVNSSPPTIVYNLPPQPRAGCVGWLALIPAGCLVVLLVIPLGLLITGVTTVNGILDGIGRILNPRPQIATVMSTETIVQSILPLGQLVSVSVELAKADINVGVEAGALNLCGYSADHVAEGAVEAGIDLLGISEESINYDAATNTYTLRLPAAQLTSCRIDYIEQYWQSVTTCRVDWDEARLLANYRALIDFREDALEGGILTRAQREAEIAIRNLVEVLTQSRVNIIFDEPQAPVAPPSCVPDMPQGWMLNEQTGQWVKNG